MNTKRMSIIILAVWGIFWAWSQQASALKPPHNASRTIGCVSCHYPRAKFRTLTGFDSLCFNQAYGCHNVFASGTSAASKKRLSTLNASNRFKKLPRDSNYATYSTNKKQSSHGWKIPNTNNDAGATVDWQNAPGLSNLRDVGPAINKRIYCSRCHQAHGETGAIRSFLRVTPRGDIICLQCHAARRVSNVRDPLPSTSLHYSHPVEVNYSSVKADPAKKDLFESAPLNPYTNNPTAELKLYTAFNYDVNTKITGVKAQKAVLCSTCHGPLHASDSNPYTFDSLTSYSKWGNVSTSAGNLLRRYPMSKSNDICTSCHKVQIHQIGKGFTCGTCHTPHKKAGENNRYLILQNISTPNSGKRPVQFISTSEMADRWTNQGEPDGKSNAICQVCHTTTKWHRNYSTLPASNKNREGHAAPNEYNSGTGKYVNCMQCHPHSGGFSPSGAACGNCHGNAAAGTSYPSDTYGKHDKHIGKTTGARYDWSGKTAADTIIDDRRSDQYGFSCGRCHNPFTPYTASKVENLRHANSNGTVYRIFTADIGFANTSKLPVNDTAKAGYTYKTGGAFDAGPNSDNYDFRGAGSGAVCRNIYCHGQFYGGYTSNDPDWLGATAQNCGKCHGASPASVPGKNGTNSSGWGAHQRHVGNANDQQYGYADPNQNFRCNACHYMSATLNNATTLDRRNHVNGRVDVKFAPAYESQNASATNYGGFNPYTTRTNTVLTSKTQFKTCGITYCHSDGSRIQGNYSTSLGALAVKFPNWSSSKNFTSFAGTTTKRRCARCHGAERVAGGAGTSFNGITAAMPGYASRPGKGNSHRKHVVDNGFMCNVCHDATVNADNRSIKNTTKHVNQYYDVVMISKYAGTYDNSSKRCSNVKCHGGRPTAMWGDPGRCQDCHFKNTPETKQDEGYYDSYAFKKFTSNGSVPRIYSTEWTQRGHGSSAATKLPKGCTDCHKQTQDNVSHETALSGNIYRVYTAAQHLDDLCLECHSDTRSKPAQADIKVQGHTAAVIGAESNATWAFTPKCIDCHDPHGDKNRGMLHTYINYSGSDTAGKRTYDNQQASGLMNFSTVGNGQINWSSFVKSNYTGICQRCHNTQVNLNHFYKESPGYDVGHNPANKCTNCHKHTEGFKPLPCDGCHKFPPTLSGKHALHVATSVSKSYVDYANESKTRFYAYGCGKCHDRTSSQHYSGQGLFTTEVVFNQSPSQKLPKNPNGSYAFGARSSIDDGAKPTPSQDSYQWVSTKGTCKNLYCHGQFFGGYSSNDPTWYGSQPCGKCHGVPSSKGNGLAPSGGAHSKHVTTYSMPCKGCHRDVTGSFNAYTVSDRSLHVNGISNIRLYTSTGDATVGSRIGRSAKYGSSSNEFAIVTTNTNPASSPAYRFCQNLYCHSKGTSTQSPYTSRVSFPNYTAKWGEALSGMKKCSYCHGNKGRPTGWDGLTSAMPTYAGQAHKIHVVDNNFSCRACHSRTVKGYATLSSVNLHVNKVRDVAILSTYSGTYNSGSKTCANVKCHGRRLTPAWSQAGINCKDCHQTSSGTKDTMDFTFRSFSVINSVPTIYSSEWAESGHGKSSGNYRVTNKPYAGKNCSTCHVSSKKHNDSSNFFRLTGLGGGTDPSTLCMRCHGTGSSQLQPGWNGFATVTGIKAHTRAVLQAEGYTNLTTWRFTPKCTDCHDPHGDARATSGNIAMIRNTVLYNYSGSDSLGRPIRFPNLTTVMFAKYNGTTSFDDNTSKGRVCAVCHKRTAHNGDGTGHTNAGLDCRTCHKHKQGFNPSGCDGCHGYPPPKGPNLWAEVEGNLATWGLHTPHAKNPRSRPGIPSENDVSGAPGYKCYKCHDGAIDSNGQKIPHGTGADYASMKNLTSDATPRDRKSDWATGGTTGKADVTDDTCSNTGCHTPRAYTRKWKKPTKCDDCHGFRNTPAKDGAAAGTYNLITSGSHKMHAYSSASFRYAFTCRNCHKYVGNNFTTHYSGFVNITFGQALGQSASTGNYGRGLTGFKGATTGGEWTTSTCSQVYCHGYFGTYSGGKSAQPKWGDKATAACGSCHGNTAGTLAKRHPAHINNYGFSCRRCHSATAGVNNTIIDQRTHVNNTENVQFNITGAMDNTNGTTWGANDARKCKNIYCHSSGARTTGNTWATRTTISNYTADWSKLAAGITGAGKGCSLCHGNRNFGNSFGGITSAMPNYPGQAHAKHAMNTAGDNFKCYVCHASTVNAAGQIISYTNHVNMFKNVSIIGTYKSGATNYNPAGTKKCDNIKCHGGRQTPAWTGSADCRDCHYKSSGFTSATSESNWRWQNYTTGKAAGIYSTEWRGKGHGTSAINRGCTKCHDTSKKHNLGSNPFRLYTSDSNKMCAACHGSGTGELGKWGVGTLGNKTGITTHSQAETAGDAGWNFPSSNPTEKSVKCVDCHDPHGDRNRSMIQSYINFTGSDKYGKPDAINTSHPGQMIFTTVGGNQMNWSSFVNGTDLSKSLCRRCHTNQGDGKMANFNKGIFTAGHNNGQKCTNCHQHKTGFQAGGEPSGTEACGGCHADLVNNMKNATKGYHHVMNSDAGTYGTETSFDGTAADLASTERRCLMCHVRHKEFSPDVTTGRKRAANLRKWATATHDNQTGINTDFWPAKRSLQYANNPVTPSGVGGVCMSCHKSVQYKNTTLQSDADKTSRTRDFKIELYTSSSHNYQINDGLVNFANNGGSSFRANCTKCHNTNDINKPSAQNGSYQLGLHNQNTQSLLDNGTSSSKPKIEDICYRCHGKRVRSTYDYYSSIQMNSGAKMIETAIIAKKTGHPIDSDAMAGRHKADEFYKVPKSYKAGRTAGEGTGSGWNRGSNRHVECTDCHNTHGGNASIVRTVGTNGISGAQAGTWGVKVTYSGTGETQPTYSTIRQVTKQYEVCLKCHSAFAYYTMPPVTPSGNIARSTTFGEWDPNSPQTDVGMDFHPNAHGFHPVVTKGRNQPPKSANASWPLTKSDWKYRDPVTDTDKFMAVSGLSWTFVPPYSQHSTLVCSDCHRADNTGNAIGRVKYKTGTSPTLVNSWTNVGTAAQAEATLYRVDDVLSTTTQASSSIQITVDYPGNAPANEPSEVWIVGYACGSDTGKTTRDFTLSATIEGTTSIGSGTYRFPLCSAGVGRGEKKATTTEVWAGLKNGTHTVKLATTATAQTVSVDYIGIEAIYKETANVRGPHGSLDRWLLVDLDRKVRFDANRDGDLLDPGDVPNSTTKTGAYATEDDFRKTFCFNCHRIDVYNGTSDNFDGVPDATNPNGEYSRVTHPVEGAVASSSLNPWGIWCLNCHGGRVYEVVGTGAGVKPWMTKRQNEIHGSFANMTVYHTTNGAVRVTINRPKGVRLLHGALLVGVNAPPSYTASGAKWTGDITCYTTDVNDSMSSCNSHAGASGTKNMTFNYSYSSW